MLITNRSLLTAAIVYFSLALNFVSLAPAQTIDSFAALTKGKIVSGFRADAVYLNESDQPMGARFVHERSGFTLDLLQIQSVPQSYIWTKTFLVSDQGEPHTQEHLLITKGNKGRNINASEGMTLSQSNASTNQEHTVYEFNTAGGKEVFYNLFDEYLDALLHPDYTEEEVRREVRNWGVTENADKTLRLEEKGSVYNEMVSSMNNPDWRSYDELMRIIYGAAHPFAMNAGGSPEGIRQMKTADIKRFHDANYHLGNMGAIVSVPSEMPLDEVLRRFDQTLNRAEPTSEKRQFMTLEKLPAPQPAATGKIKIVEFPSKNEQQAASMQFAYPATRQLDSTEKLLLNVFLNCFAGDANTNLYKKLVDTKTREIDLGAKGVYGYVENAPGNPVLFGLSDVSAANLTEEKAALAREKIVAEFARVAAFKDDSPELREFNERFQNALIEYRRSLSKFVNTPPGFGFRSGGNGYGWYLQTQNLNETRDFRKSVTLKTDFDAAEKLVSGSKNVWRNFLGKWNLLNVKPYAVVAQPSAKLIEQDLNERKARADAETAELKKKYNVADDQQAIRLYKADYDKTTAEQEKLEKTSGTKFIENPPLSLDDQLDFQEKILPNNVKLVAANFDSMTGATSGLALRLDSIQENELVYLSLLPVLLRQTGVIKNGKPLSYEEMSEMLRKEILSLDLEFQANFKTNRYELVARGAGNNAQESARAVEWMRLVLQNPNWRKENLPRIRDVVDRQLSDWRRRMQDAEETWVSNPADAYANQTNPLFLATQSFLTQAHNAQRLRWMLKDAGDAENQKAVEAFLNELGAAQGTREELKTLLAAMQSSDKTTAAKTSGNFKSLLADFATLPPTAKNLAVEAAKDLEQNLSEIPDASMAADWKYLCGEMRLDLQQTPEKTLANLDAARRKLLKTGNARMFVIGARQTQAKLDADYKTLLAGFENAPAAKADYSTARLIDERLKGRGAATEKTVYVGLLAPNMTGGVFINTAPLADYADAGDREKMLDFLASKLYGGGRAHSVFSRTIGAGLAYSNGVGSSPASGLFRYYAERTPELPQTLRFAIGEVKRPLNDETLGEYVIAQNFSSRAASPYEARGEAMAANLADGITPAAVRRFRQIVLDLRKTPNLSEELMKRKDKVYERILPGYGIKGKDVKDANYFVIGSEKQMTAYEAYLKSAEGADTKLYRLYPRDFWLTIK